MDVLINLIVVTVSQCIHIANHHIVHFKLYNFTCQLYLIKLEKINIKNFKFKKYKKII